MHCTPLSCAPCRFRFKLNGETCSRFFDAVIDTCEPPERGAPVESALGIAFERGGSNGFQPFEQTSTRNAVSTARS